MAGPAIPYDKLFDFPGFFKALDEAQARTTEWANLLGKIADRTKTTLSETLSQVSGKKLEIIPEKELTKLQDIDKSLNNLSASVNQSRESLSGFNKISTMAVDSISAINAESKKLVKQIQDLSVEERNNEEIGGVKIKRLNELKEATIQYGGTVSSTIKILTVSESSYNKLSQELIKMKAQLRDMNGAYDLNTGQVNKNNKAAVELNNKITQTDATLKKIDSTMGQYTRNVGNYEGATVSLRQQMREMTIALVQMEQEGKRGTAAYTELVQKAGQLQDTMSDVSSEIRRTGSDTRTIEGMVGVFQGIAGAAGIAEAATQLFGDENDDLVKGIQRLQIIQTAMMGVQQIANMLQKESAAIVMIINFQDKIKILQTQLQGAAESKNIVIRYAAIIAQKLLNAAMTDNPAGILIMAMIALAGAVLLFSNHTKTAAENLEKLNEFQSRNYELVELYRDALKNANNESQINADNRIKEAKAQGIGQLELINLEIEAAKIREQNALKIKTYTDSQTKNLWAQVYGIEEMTKEVAKLTNEYEILSIKQDTSKKLKKLAEQKKIELDLERKKLQDALNANKDYADAKNDLDNKMAEQVRIIAEHDLMDKKAIIESNLAKSKEESKNELEQKIKLLENEKAKELLNKDLSLNQQKAIADKYARQESDMRKNYAQKEKENNFNASIAITEGKLSIVRKGTDEEFRLKEELITEQYNLDVSSIEFSIKNEELRKAKLKEIYDKQLADKRELEKEKQLAELDRANVKALGGESLEIIKNQEIMASSRSTFKEMDQARIANENLAQQAIDREMLLNENKFSVLKKLGLDDVQATADYEKQKTDLLIQQEDLKLKKIQETARIESEIQQSTVDFLLGINDAALTMFKDQSEAKIEQFGREKDMSIRAAGDNTDAKARIEAEYTKKANAEKRKAAKAEKAAALFSAVINTALAVIKGLNTMPFFPLGLLMAVLAGVLGGIQIAAIASKPLPTYKRGTKFAQEGPAIVNDEPGSIYQEMIMRDDKAYLPQGRNQMVYLKRGDKVIRAAETKGIREGIKRAAELEKMMNESSLQDALAVRLEAGRKFEIIHNMTDAMLGAKVSEKLIGEEVGKHLKNIPQPVNIWDERGHRKGLRKGNSLVIYLNERNSL